MNYSIITTFRFGKELKRLAKKFPSLKTEFAKLIKVLSANPAIGIFIRNNCYKIRMAIGSKGRCKRGGARVISYLYIKTETVYLLTIYDKGEKGNLKPNELKEMLDSLEMDE